MTVLKPFPRLLQGGGRGYGVNHEAVALARTLMEMEEAPVSPKKQKAADRLLDSAATPRPSPEDHQ